MTDTKPHHFLRSISLLVYGTVIRLFVTFSDGLFSFPNHQYSPLPYALKALKESLFMLKTVKSSSVYDSPVAYQTPLILLVFSFIPEYLLKIFIILLDLTIACFILWFAKKVCQRKRFEKLPRLLYVFYLFNPFIIASVASGSLIIIRNLVLVLLLFQCVPGGIITSAYSTAEGSRKISNRREARLAMFLFAFLVYLDWNYIVLLGGILLLLKNGKDEYFDRETDVLTQENEDDQTTIQNDKLEADDNASADSNIDSNGSISSNVNKQGLKHRTTTNSNSKQEQNNKSNERLNDKFIETNLVQNPSHGIFFVLEMLVWFFIWLGLLFYASYFVTGKSWKWIDRIYGRIFRVEDLSPNWGNYWYFFTEVFEEFRTYFILLFNLQHFAFVIPLFLKFRRNPIYMITIMVMILSTFTTNPSFGGIFFALNLHILFVHLTRYTKYTFILLVFCIYTCVSGPAFFRTWVYTGTGNANFFYFMTLGFLLSHILLITDSISAMLRWETRVQKAHVIDEESLEKKSQ